jgi:hypothetical protein
MCIVTLEILIDEVAPQYLFVSLYKTRAHCSDRFLYFQQPDGNLVQQSTGANRKSKLT